MFVKKEKKIWGVECLKVVNREQCVCVGLGVGMLLCLA